jgi:hypothetical protein
MGRNNRILRIQILSIQNKNLSKKIKTSEYFLFGPVNKADQKPHGPVGYRSKHGTYHE